MTSSTRRAWWWRQQVSCRRQEQPREDRQDARQVRREKMSNPWLQLPDSRPVPGESAHLEGGALLRPQEGLGLRRNGCLGGGAQAWRRQGPTRHRNPTPGPLLFLRHGRPAQRLPPGRATHLRCVSGGSNNDGTPLGRPQGGGAGGRAAQLGRRAAPAAQGQGAERGGQARHGVTRSSTCSRGDGAGCACGGGAVHCVTHCHVAFTGAQ